MAEPAKLTVAWSRNTVCFKLTGRASFASTNDFKAAVAALRQRGCAQFALNLAECLSMDSTWLGVLAGQAKTFRAAQPPLPPWELSQPSPRVREQLENLGILSLFTLVDAAPAEPGNHVDVTPTASSKVDLARTCLEAHQTLMEVNPANVSRFKDVTRFLQEDLHRLTTPPA